MMAALGIIGITVLPQLLEQFLRCLKISRIEPLGEPAVPRREYFARFGSPPLFAPQLGEAHRGAQLVRLGLLRSRDAQRLLEGAFCLFEPVETLERHSCAALKFRLPLPAA